MMSKNKCLNSGIILWVIGILAFYWVLTEQEKEIKLIEEQQQNLNVKLDGLNSQLKEKLSVRSFVDRVKKEFSNHDNQNNSLVQKREARELIFFASILSMVLGGTILTGLLLLNICGRLIPCFSDPNKLFIRFFKRIKPTPKKDEPTSEPKKQPKISQTKPKVHAQLSSKPQPSKEKILTSYSSDKAKAEEIKFLYCDKSSVVAHTQNQQALDQDHPDKNNGQFDQLEQNICNTILSGYNENALKVEDSIKTQTENLKKQFAEFKQMTEAVKETTLEYSKPLNTNFNELTQQISAIRDYASCQQERMEKLQEGYDWNIIRTFCLKIIRCIDNLDKRIKATTEDSIFEDLEEIRDELLFALESSNVEQFVLEINSQYAEQEKFAEVIKEKESTQNPDMKGKIAKIIRPGYQYVIDDENNKVVRVARVKLFA